MINAMSNKEIFSHVDHSLLSPTATRGQIEQICREGLEYEAASVCIPPCYVEFAAAFAPKLVVCTVIGFPLGYETSKTKIAAAKEAVQLGAAEIDMVINQTAVKNADFESVTNEIAQIKQVVGDRILKVIIETCNLSQEEKQKLCGCVASAGADYIKTSTGFGSAGAALEDIELFKQYLPSCVKIKAAGAIKTKNDMLAFLAAGADRLGTSSAVKILHNT